MDKQRQAAYRYLLYVAMLAIRMDAPSRGSNSFNPLVLWQQYRKAKCCGAVADWLHNLALFSALDFEGFDELAFWQGYKQLCELYPRVLLWRYQEVFEEHLMVAPSSS